MVDVKSEPQAGLRLGRTPAAHRVAKVDSAPFRSAERRCRDIKPLTYQYGS